jgi:hypothetical protein
MASPDDIFQYLPLRYKTQDEENYIKFLWEGFELNYRNEKYQFAFIAYHLLFMTYVYFQIWKIYAVFTDDFRKSILGFHKIDSMILELEERNEKNKAEGNPIEQFYPFSFSEENERTIMTFFRLIGCDKSKIVSYKKLVDDRNEIAHANGRMIFVASKDIDKKIEQILKLIGEIQSHSCETAKQCLIKFMMHDSDIETREHIDDLDQINEVLIRGHYVSPKDIEEMLAYDLSKFSSESNFSEIESLFHTFFSTYHKDDETQAA